VTQVYLHDQSAQIKYDDGDDEKVEGRTIHLVNPAGAPPPPPPQGGGGQWAMPPPPPQAPPPPQMMGPGPDVNAFMQVPGLYVKQRVDYGEVMADLLGGVVGGLPGDLMQNFEQSNTYDIYTDRQMMESKQRWMFAKEESDACTRYACQHRREFRLRIGAPIQGPPDQFSLAERLGLGTSESVVPAIELERPCYCCLSEMFVRDGRGRDIGHFEEECTNLIGCCPLKAKLESGQGNFTLEGPPPCWIDCCMSCPCRDPFEFHINREGGGEEIGSVLNVPNGCCKMCFTSADEYELRFAPQATADQRAMIIAACFALDYAYFECKNEPSTDNGGGGDGGDW